jgi:hypothetical protein
LNFAEQIQFEQGHIVRFGFNVFSGLNKFAPFAVSEVVCGIVVNCAHGSLLFFA